MPPKPSELVAAKTANLNTNQQLSRENTLNLIKLRGQSQGKTGVDINIHGTFARGADWVKQGSGFESANKRNSTVSTNFQWTGGKTESARKEAGKQLGAFIKDVNRPAINQASSNEVNAIAHSHGGNVLGKALGRQSTPGISNAVMLGTPQMSKGGQNTSWTQGGADKVRGNIMNIYDNKDAVQVTGASANEYAQGNFVSVGRTFAQSNSTTPQSNIRVETGAYLSSAEAHSNTHDASIGNLTNHLLGKANSRQGRIGSAMQREQHTRAKFQGNLANRPASKVFNK